MFYVYILQSIDFGTYYIGVTVDIQKRLTQHNYGLAKSTKAKRPWRLVYSRGFDTLSAGRTFENKLKSIKKRKALEEFIKHF